MSSESQFARQQLEKYGWKEGKGLGREEGGMTEAFRPKLKFNSAGLGYDIAEEYKFHWWDHAFNKAVQNIEVTKAQDGSVQLVRKEELHVSKKKSPIDKKAKVYGTFVKGGTLVGEKEEKENLDREESEDKEDLSLSLTDEELFKLCGKRTGHKGARHGLTMSAKLARVAEQDQLLMENWTKSSEHFKQEPCNSKTEKKKKKKQRVGDASEVNFKQPDIEISVVKKLKASGNEDAFLSAKDIEENEQSCKRRRMKKYNHKIMECVENASLDNSSEDLLVRNIHSTHVENNDIKNTSKIENKKGKNNISIAGDVDEHTANGTEGQGVVVKKKNNITNAIDVSKYTIVGEGKQAEERKKKKAKKEKGLNEKKIVFNEGIEETNLDKKKEIEEIETVDFCGETFESRKKKKHKYSDDVQQVDHHKLPYLPHRKKKKKNI